MYAESINTFQVDFEHVCQGQNMVIKVSIFLCAQGYLYRRKYWF